jgi:hypothetical protein
MQPTPIKSDSTPCASTKLIGVTCSVSTAPIYAKLAISDPIFVSNASTIPTLCSMVHASFVKIPWLAVRLAPTHLIVLNASTILTPSTMAPVSSVTACWLAVSLAQAQLIALNVSTILTRSKMAPVSNAKVSWLGVFLAQIQLTVSTVIQPWALWASPLTELASVQISTIFSQTTVLHVIQKVFAESVFLQRFVWLATKLQTGSKLLSMVPVFAKITFSMTVTVVLYVIPSRLANSVRTNCSVQNVTLQKVFYKVQWMEVAFAQHHSVCPLGGAFPVWFKDAKTVNQTMFVMNVTRMWKFQMVNALSNRPVCLLFILGLGLA